MAATTGQSFNIGPYGKNILKLFFTVPFKSKFGLEFTLWWPYTKYVLVFFLCQSEIQDGHYRRA